MWYKVRELQSKGLNKTQIGKHLGVDRSTVRKYLQMSREDFVRRRNSHRKYTLKLAGYEEYVRGTLEEYPYISAARMHDWLRECYPDFPKVCDKTVFNFVEKVRCKYGIGKKSEARIRRDYEKLPDTPYGKYAQADFGEKWMSAENGRSTKVYFFAIVLARSRYKFTCFSRRPFDTELAIYAHERAFEYFGGKPEKILYDQDRVLISRENLGDLVLTRKFQTFVREQHFQPVFCHKADPESKGKVENVVKYVKENFLVARVFRDIDSLNREALEWLERTGNGKVHGTARLVPRGRVCRGEKFSHTLSWDATATAGGDEGIPCPQGQYSAVQGELLQPAMRNLPERADNLAAGDGRECGAVQQGYGEAHLPACALYPEGKDRL